LEAEMITEQNITGTDSQNSVDMDASKYNFTFHTLRPLSSFGKLFLTREVDKGQPLFASKCSCICAKQSHFIVVTRKAFEKIKYKVISKMKQAELTFLKTVPQLSDLNKKMLNKINNSKELITYKRNQVLQREGEPANFVYIV
jgi:hypothetical protein